MVDLHSHILPGLDDGAETLEQSLAMLHMAAASGTTDIVATPHCDSRFSFNPRQVAQAISEIRLNNQSHVNIHSGCDFHLTYDNLQDALNHPTKYTINQGPYLMVELPEFVQLKTTRQVLRRLLDAGIVPVITHPERNPTLQVELKTLSNWVAEGSLLQVTAGSLLGTFGTDAQRSARALLKSRLVHFVASDAHNTSRRSPDLSVAFRHVSTAFGAQYAESLFRANPRAVIQSRPLLPGPAPQRKRAGLFSFLSKHLANKR